MSSDIDQIITNIPNSTNETTINNVTEQANAENLLNMDFETTIIENSRYMPSSKILCIGKLNDDCEITTSWLIKDFSNIDKIVEFL